MPNFYYVYILKSLRDGRFYAGSTQDLKKRLELHNAGVIASTKPRRPFELIFYEAYRNERDGKRREAYFKTTKGKRTLQTMISEYLKNRKETSQQTAD